jgi:Zn-dependent protease with chaperone function
VDFYSHQAAARRQSQGLVWMFLLAVAGVVLALDLVFFTWFGAGGEDGEPGLGPLGFVAAHPGFALFWTLLIVGVIGCASLFKSLQLRSGGGVVATSLGGVRLEPDTTDPKRRRLRNVVEEMAIASGVPVPEIYVLEGETGINAFAAGHTPANAAVAVTQGALDRLNREQLQGVIAHEFSHVVNGDMRLNLQLMGMVFGLLVVAIIGRTVLRFAPRGGKKGGGALLLAALAVMLLGYAGLFAARIIQAAVSRQREKLADASAVQFTRNPGGLKDALLKIAGLDAGSKLQSPKTDEVAHMLFAPGLSPLFATHPSLAERIKTLDPGFDVRSLPRLAAEVALVPIDIDDFAASEPLVAHAAPAGADVAADPKGIAAQVGQVDTLQIERAQALRLAFPAGFRDFAVTPAAARTLVLGLLLSRDQDVLNRQLTTLANSLDPAALAATRRGLDWLARLPAMLRLPALQAVYPALRRLPVAERHALCALCDALITADARIDVFEFCLARLLETLLRDELEPRAPHGPLRLAECAAELRLLFCVLAAAGANDETQARAAFGAGIVPLQLQDARYAVASAWQRELGPALARLDMLRPRDKQVLIEGLVRTVAHDQVLSVAEAELLRTVCAILHCPLPPLLPGVSADAA